MKKSVLLVVTFFILFLLGGCRTLDASNEEMKQDSQGDSSVGENSSQVSQKNIALDIPYQIDKTLENGIKVRTAVQISPEIDINRLKTYKVFDKKHDIEKAKALLLANKEIIASEENSIDENRVINITETKDGCSLLSNFRKDIRLYGSLGQEISFALNKNYLSQEKNDEKFLAKQELSFSTREQVTQAVLEIAKELDVNIISSPVIYSFSKGQSYTTPVFSESGMIEETKYFTRDCYFLEFQIAVDNIPVSKEMSGSEKNGNGMSGTALEVLYSAEGIEEFYMYGDYEIVETLSENQKGISAEEALQRLEDKYDTIILEGEYTVERIDFEYIPLPEKEGQYTLVPVWRFGINHAVEFSGKTDRTEIVRQNERSFVIFNAITGEEILTDSGSA